MLYIDALILYNINIRARMIIKKVTTEAFTLANPKILLCGNTFLIKIPAKSAKIRQK